MRWPTRWQWLVGLALTAMIVFGAVARLHTLHEPFERDLHTYAVIGHELLQGRALYSDLWDNKPPGVFVLYAGFEWLFGYGDGAIYAINVFFAALTLIGVAWAAAGVVGDARGRRAPMVAALGAAVLWSSLSLSINVQANQPNTELMLNALLALAFASLLDARRRSVRGARILEILAGFCIALASTFKQIAVLSAVSVFFVRLVTRKVRFREILALTLPAALGWLLIAVYFGLTDRGAIAWKSLVAYPREYAGGLLRSLLTGFRDGHFSPDFLWSLAVVQAVTILAPFLLRRTPGVALFSAWLLSVPLLISAPGRFHPHYYQFWLPVMSVGVAAAGTEVGWVALHTRGALARARSLAAVALILVAALSALRIPHQYFSKSAVAISEHKYGGFFVAVKDLALELRPIFAARGITRVYMWGTDPGFYYYLGLSPVTGAIWSDVISSRTMGVELSARLESDLRRRPPQAIIAMKGRAFPPALRDLIVRSERMTNLRTASPFDVFLVNQ